MNTYGSKALVGAYSTAMQRCAPALHSPFKRRQFGGTARETMRRLAGKRKVLALAGRGNGQET
jgi:hypothetical protein